MASLYDAIRTPWASWPMTMQAHDPTNFRVLDVSGNGRHLTLGDGAGSNEPTKLTQKRGYRPTASANRAFLNGFTQWTSNRITVEVITGGRIAAADADVVGLFGAGALNFLVQQTTNQVRFFSGSSGGTNYANMPIGVGYKSLPTSHIVGRYDGTATSIWIGGRKGTNATAPLAPNSGDSGQNLRLFSRFNSTGGSADIYLCRIWDKALTDVQIRELARKAKQELTRI